MFFEDFAQDFSERETQSMSTATIESIHYRNEVFSDVLEYLRFSLNICPLTLVK